jgi:hypothetical protein
MPEPLPIDAVRYPIEDPEEDAGGVIAGCRAQLDQTGLCILPGFLVADAVADCVAGIQAEVPSAFRKEHQIVAMDESEIEAAVPVHDSVRKPHRHAMRVIPYDRISAASPVRHLYEWDGMTDFLSRVLGVHVYRCADPLLSLTITAMEAGDEQGWHFDDNEFVVSLLLQKPARGGEFQYVPMIRNENDPALERIRAVFEGAHQEVQIAPLEPGTLALFRGTRSLHRVSRVAEGPARLIALLSYDKQPGMAFPSAVQRNNTGRTIHT